MSRSRSPLDDMADKLARLTAEPTLSPSSAEAETAVPAETSSEPAADDTDLYARARHRALGFLSRREHAYKELIFKLGSGPAGVEFDQELIEQVVADLAEQGLQSDSRYADVMVRHRHEQGHGPIKLRAELSRWNVASSDADCYGELDWYEACARIAEKRYQGKPIADFKDRAKRQRYLASRGFERDHIDHALEKVDFK